MKTIFATIIAVAATAANADIPELREVNSEMCGNVAKLATLIAKADEKALESLEKGMLAAKSGDHIHTRNTKKDHLSIYRQAYYSWNSFDEKTIRALAYTKCIGMIEQRQREELNR